MSSHVGKGVWVNEGDDLTGGVTIERATGGVVEVPEIDVRRLGTRGAIELSGGEREALRDELRGGLAMTGSWGGKRMNRMWVGDDYEELPWDDPVRVAEEALGWHCISKYQGTLCHCGKGAFITDDPTYRQFHNEYCSYCIAVRCDVSPGACG